MSRRRAPVKPAGPAAAPARRRGGAWGLRRDWDRFWFARVGSAPLGLFRIAFGLLALLYGLLLFPDRSLWYSDRGVLTAAAAAIYNSYNPPGPRIWLLGPATDNWLTPLFVLFLLAALCLALGLWTRLASVVVFLGLSALHARDGVINNYGDTVMIVMAAYLVFAPAGAACSLDRLRRVLSGRESPARAPRVAPWAQRLMQVQVSLIYLSTLLGKLGGSDWRDGTALYYPGRLTDTARLPLPLVDADHLAVVNLLTWGTLAAEFALAFLVWVPRLRLTVLAVGVALHLGIEYTLNIPLFSALMISSYIVFLTPNDLRWLTARQGRLLSSARLRLLCERVGGHAWPPAQGLSRRGT